MIAGHFGFAAAVKSRERATPLWALMLATVWLDIVFVPLLFMKVETLKPVPGVHQPYGGNLSMPTTRTPWWARLSCR
ncbi:MAG: hypothetical protein WDN06_00420 [Asticcacaulis sp.]